MKKVSPVQAVVIAVVSAKILVLSIGYAITSLSMGNSGPADVFNQLFLHWDATHYQNIAINGYASSGKDADLIVFFPLYPWLIKTLAVNAVYANIKALIIANTAGIVASFYLYKLAKLEFNESVAVMAVVFFSFFPVAYFLAVPYTEGLFLAFAIACFYYARVGRWQFAGGLAFLVALTRLSGLLLLPMLLVEYFHQVGWKPLRIKANVCLSLFPVAGFLVYLGLNTAVTGAPLTFVNAEATHWYNTFDPQLGFDNSWFWINHKLFPENVTVGYAPIIFVAFGAAMICVALWKRLRPAYIVYMVGCLGLATSTSLWVSAPRYLFAMFPMFFVLALLTKRKTINGAILMVSILYLCFFTVLFALGEWAF
jgi:hypothetical protein